MTNYFEKRIIESDFSDYESFAKVNREKVNKYLNAILWYCILTGPAIALGIRMGIFEAVSYSTCFFISLVMFVVALAHYLILRKWPASLHASIYALMAMELLLMRMAYSHIHINITWFFVPLVSILFCNRKLYIYAVISNFLVLHITTILVAPHYASINSDYDTVKEYYLNAVAGYAIETGAMLLVGLALIKIVDGYIRNLIEKNKETKVQMEQTSAQMDILNSMAGIYDNANLIDFKKMTETAIVGGDLEPRNINLEAHAHTRLNHRLKRKVAADQFDEFQEFTNIRTVCDRLKGRKSIYKEFINVDEGWFRAQYISVETDENGVPTLIVYTVQNIEAQKHREEQLIRISRTDELTRLYNRRCFEEDIAVYDTIAIEDDLVIASIDLNRLKYANDTKGHVAGDELIKAAAECLEAAIYTTGKVYRTGGDEFTAVIHTRDIDAINKEIQDRAAAWKGKYMDSLAMSVGYAAHRKYPYADIKELCNIADKMMYEEKNRYYKENGFDRRGQSRFPDRPKKGYASE